MSSVLEVFKKYSTEILLGYFLILWGLGDLLSVVSNISYLLTHLNRIDFGSLFDLGYAVLNLFSGLILIVLGSRIAQETEQA